MNTIVQSGKHEGMYYINTKPVLLENWRFMSVTDRFNISEIEDFEKLLNINGNDNKSLLNKITYLVSNHYNVNIKKDTRKREVCEPRQIAMYLCVKFRFSNKVTITYQDIAKHFNMNHATIFHACKNLNWWLKVDNKIIKDVDRLSNKIEKYTTNQIIVVD